MHDFTRAAAALLVMGCVAGGAVGLLVGSVLLILNGEWTLAAGSCGLIGAGILFGNWFIDEKVEDQSGPLR